MYSAVLRLNSIQFNSSNPKSQFFLALPLLTTGSLRGKQWPVRRSPFSGGKPSPQVKDSNFWPLFQGGTRQPTFSGTAKCRRQDDNCSISVSAITLSTSSSQDVGYLSISEFLLVILSSYCYSDS